MATAQRPAFGQYSVVLRPRQGIPCSFSTYGVIMCVAKHLEPYNCICNVAFSPPNYVVHLPTLELQLQILACKTFSGQDYLFDILPWSSEYASCNLPWLPSPSDQDSSVPPSVHSISNAETNSGTESSLVNPSPEITKIQIPITQERELQEIIFDFSYFMICEIKEFYLSKIEAFSKCKETCKELYHIAKVFASEASAAIEKLCNKTKPYTDVDREDPLYHVGRLSDGLYHDLWFISEETFALDLFGKPIWATHIPSVDLHAYEPSLPHTQMPIPVLAKGLLQTIAETVVLHIYHKQLLISTDKDHTETFCTQIWCTDFYHEYKTRQATSAEEAEANAVFRFLKYVTNCQGYTILDHNSDQLCTMISNINCVSISLSELHLEVNRVSKFISTVYENNENLQRQIPAEICEDQIADTVNALEDFLTLLKHYRDTADHGLQTFIDRKNAFRCIKLKTLLPPTPDVS